MPNRPVVPRTAARALTRNVPVVMAYIGLGVLLIVYSYVGTQPFSAVNISSMMNSTVILMIIGMGETIVIVSGGIDVSVAGTLAMANTFIATTMTAGALSITWVILATLALGAAVGLLNGIFIARAKMAPLIVTLAMLSVTQGVALWLLPVPGGSVPTALTELSGNTSGGIPIAAIFMACAAALWLILKKTRLGRDLYAIGGDESAAYANGVRVSRTKVCAYVLAGVFAAAAAIVLTSQTSSGDPSSGTSFILESLVVVVLGGTSLAGGRGGVGGTLAGAFMLTIINDIVFFAGVSSFYQEFFQGIILLVAIAVASARRPSRGLAEGEA